MQINSCRRFYIMITYTDSKMYLKVMMNIYGVHMDPTTWNDPENFRPERFLNEENVIVGKDRAIPFGVGESCNGDNGLILVFHIL